MIMVVTISSVTPYQTEPGAKRLHARDRDVIPSDRSLLRAVASLLVLFQLIVHFKIDRCVPICRYEGVN